MIQGILYKNFIVLRKYYIWLLVGLTIIYLVLSGNLVILTTPFVLLIFQGICMSSIFQVDDDSKFKELIYSSVGEQKYIRSLYIMVVFNIGISILAMLFIMLSYNVSHNIILLFLGFFTAICSLIWAFQIPLSYKGGTSTFRTIEFLFIIGIIVFLGGFASQYFGVVLDTIIKFEPVEWNRRLGINFAPIIEFLLLIFSVFVLVISRFALIKVIEKGNENNVEKFN